MGSSSWAHTAYAMTAEDKADRLRHQWTCARSRCAEWPAVAISYRYVTGRAGRATTRTQAVCQAHGEAFAAKHGIEIGPEAPIYGTPTQRMVSQAVASIDVMTRPDGEQ